MPNKIEIAVSRLEALFPEVEPPLREQIEKRDFGDSLLDKALEGDRKELVVLLHQAGYDVRSDFQKFLDESLEHLDTAIEGLGANGALRVLQNSIFDLVLHRDETTAKTLTRLIYAYQGEGEENERS